MLCVVTGSSRIGAYMCLGSIVSAAEGSCLFTFARRHASVLYRVVLWQTDLLICVV